jgi:hypothetical protein
VNVTESPQTVVTPKNGNDLLDHPVVQALIHEFGAQIIE